MPHCNRKENQADPQVCRFTSINLLFAPTTQAGVRAIVCKDWPGLQKSEVNTSLGGIKREKRYLRVSLAAGFTSVFSVPSVVSRHSTAHSGPPLDVSGAPVPTGRWTAAPQPARPSLVDEGSWNTLLRDPAVPDVWGSAVSVACEWGTVWLQWSER